MAASSTAPVGVLEARSGPFEVPSKGFYGEHPMWYSNGTTKATIWPGIRVGVPNAVRRPLPPFRDGSGQRPLHHPGRAGADRGRMTFADPDDPSTWTPVAEAFAGAAIR
ncbi:hypothetical protein JCM9534A_06020 [Catenuloplanes indicus JCM 9534]